MMMYGQPQQNNANTAGNSVTCHFPSTVGALLAFLGFVLAACGEFLTGSELGNDNVDADELRKFAVVCGVGILMGALGYFVTSDSLCGSKRDRPYFGNLLILVGLVCASAFLFGTCWPIREESALNKTSVQSYSYLVGVAFLVASLGWFVAHRDSIVCKLGVFNPSTLGHALVTIFTLIAGVLFIVYAYYFTFDFQSKDADTLMGVRIAVGVCDVFLAIGFALAIGC